ncbi:beta-xylanase [Puia dinghuensis]|uniref:Beta-xylanase n=2 Tax=Puia dinghuensis TaxID=1792502 RepID=A0A8J2UDX4_9BACT|nr:beta-xylanase [Puia dinghuensis]
MPLYGTDPIPNSRPAANAETIDSSGRPIRYSYSKVSRPTLTVWQPPAGKRTGTAVIVCPGGGYVHLAMTHEGTQVAAWLNSLGITAFVLKYRLPDDETMVDKTIGPLQDAQRAIQLVRQRAGEWGVNPGKIGILGFSAGGHLASTAGTHFTTPVIANPAGVSLRPDFMVLLYPVISFDDSIGHRGSRDNLIGKQPSPEGIKKFSNELQVTDQTPPAFLVHAEDDRTVPVINSLEFYIALMRHRVPAELHVYPKGGHGFGMHNPTTTDQWPDRLVNWLTAGGWL